jgi:hypothetical protein
MLFTNITQMKKSVLMKKSLIDGLKQYYKDLLEETAKHRKSINRKITKIVEKKERTFDLYT